MLDTISKKINYKTFKKKMKKFLFAVALVASCLFGAKNADAQAVLGKGEMMLNLGFGCVNSSFNKDWNKYNVNSIFSPDAEKEAAQYAMAKYYDYCGDFFVPTANFALDCGIIDGIINQNGGISVGLYGGFGTAAKREKATEDGDKAKSTLRDTKFNLGLRGLFHYSFAPNFDCYAGLDLGYVRDTWKYKFKENGELVFDHKEPWGRFQAAPLIGVKFMFNKAVGVYSELSEPNSHAYFQIGLTLHF